LDYDYVTVEPTQQEFTGNHDNTWSQWFDINATSANVRLETDSSITQHGFEIDQVEWNGAPICPAIAYPPCGAGTVDVAAPAGTCQCPPMPICAPIADVEVSHFLARGFNRTTKTAHGATATFTHPGPADGPETDTIGTIDTVRLAALVRRAATLGLLQGPGYTHTVPAGGTQEDFTIVAGPYTVTFSAAQGAQSAAVLQLINEFEALFACDNGGGLTCGANYTCEQSSCIETQQCVCTTEYNPVCGTNGHTYGNACNAGCANVEVAHNGECGIPGDACGTLFGLTCQSDNRCRYAASTFSPPYPDAGGTCVAPNYCDAAADCNGLPHPAVLGAWACNANACAWQAGIPWKTLIGGHFDTPSPYANNVSVWKDLYLPADAQALRLRATRFATEASYDKLEVWTWKNGAWAKIKTYSGTAGPTLTDEFPGQYHYLHFVSDSSITAAGISLDAEYR
ncbi:MAG TPA: Kazal-type serine protease inhibitor family protein, partial [Kofleriaceae bacterium]